MIGNVLKKLFSYVKRHAGLLWVSFFCALISVSCTLASPMIIGRLVNDIAAPGGADFDAIGNMLFILGGIFVGAVFFLWLMNYLSNRLAYKITNNLRENLFEKLNSLPLSTIDSHPRGDMISRFINDVDAVSTGLIHGLVTFFTGVVTVALAVWLMLTINPLMTLVVSASGPLTFFITWLNVKKSQKYFREQAKVVGDLNGFAEEMIQGLKVVWAFRREKKLTERFEAINQRLRVAGVKAQFISSFSNPTSRIVNSTIYTFVGVTAALEAIKGNLTVGDITSFLIFAVIFAKPFNEFTGIISQIQAAIASSKRIFDIFDMPSETKDSEATAMIEKGKGHISFNDVCFSYLPEVPVIDNFNLEAKPGSTIAIVGHTGAGKTTLVNLLMRFYEVESGTIKIDGIDIRDISRDSLRSNFGMVLQDTWLFEGSIRDNIAYSKPDASMEQIIAAAQAAGADDFIRKLENGYDTVLRDAGESLSQGQRQLLAIARVMLADPPILILDEATSNIDTLAELRIQRSFLKMTEGKTSFIIAHRLSTIRNADVILLMDNGRIAETGHHEELLEKNGLYANLYYSQFRQ